MTPIRICCSNTSFQETVSPVYSLVQARFAAFPQVPEVPLNLPLIQAGLASYLEWLNRQLDSPLSNDDHSFFLYERDQVKDYLNERI